MIPGSETKQEPVTKRTNGSKTKKSTTHKTKLKQLRPNVETVSEWQSIAFGRSEGFSWYSGSDTNKTDQHVIIYDSIWNGYQKRTTEMQPKKKQQQNDQPDTNTKPSTKVNRRYNFEISHTKRSLHDPVIEHQCHKYNV